MKVKDLRDYLELREVSTEMCREKDELVFLIISQQPPIPPGDRTTWATPFVADSPAPQPNFEAVLRTGLPDPTSMDVSPAWDSPDLALETEESPQVPPASTGLLSLTVDSRSLALLATYFIYRTSFIPRLPVAFCSPFVLTATL